MPTQLANPGAPAPWQMAQAGLINAMQTSPNDPTQLLGDPAMNPSQQQITDVQQAPLHAAMAHAYQQYHQQRQARSSAGGMMANRATAQTPMTQHLQQARGQNGGSMYINQGFGSLEDQNLPAYTQEQGMQDHPTEDFGPVAPTPATAAETQREQFELQKAHQEELDKGQQQADKEATDYQQSLQGTGKYAEDDAKDVRASASSARADQRLNISDARDTLKRIETDPAYQTMNKYDPRRLNGDDIAIYNNAKQAIQGTFAPTGTGTSPAATTGVKAIPAHPEGVEVVDNTTGKRYVVQNGQYVEKQ